MTLRVDGNALVALQRQCHAMIVSVGGYWAPTAGVSRILEELGELVHAINLGAENEALEEAADVAIILTAVANQYCAHVSNAMLNQAYEKIGAISTIAEIIDDLTISAGALARCVLILEGIKPLKPNEAPPSLSQRYCDCMVAVHMFFQSHGRSLIDDCQQVTRAKTKRDADRFRPRSDPVSAPVLDRFRPVLLATNCPFAAEARLWGCPDWVAGEDLPDYVRRVRPVFERFSSVTPHQLIDGLVLELPAHLRIGDVQGLAKAANVVLRTLHALDSNPKPHLFDSVLTPEWQFGFAGTELFVLTLSDIYPSTSSRYTFGVEGSFMLFQPAISFESAHVPRGESKETTRMRIRARFASEGRDYQGKIIDTPLEAPRYVKPLHGAETPVEWWKAE